MHGIIPIRRELLLLLTLIPWLTGCAVIPGKYGLPKIVGMSAETAAVVQRAQHRHPARLPTLSLRTPGTHQPTVGVPRTVSTHQQQPTQQSPTQAQHHATTVTPVSHQQPVQAGNPVTVVAWEEPVQTLRRVPPAPQPVVAERAGVVQLSGQYQSPQTNARAIPRRLAQRSAPAALSPVPPPPVVSVPAVPVVSQRTPPPTVTVAVPVSSPAIPPLAIPPCGPCGEKPAPVVAPPAKPPQIHTDQIAALVKRVASMEAELRSSNQSIVTLHKALMKANAEVKRLNASVTQWQSEVKRLEVAMQTQHESDIDSLNRISEMLGVLAETEGTP